MYNLLYFVIWYYNMCETEAFRFREPKAVVEEEDQVDKAIFTSTKQKNKWAVTIFNECRANCIKGSSTCIGFWKHV